MYEMIHIVSLAESYAERELRKHKFPQYVALSREAQYEMELQKSALMFTMMDRLGLTDPWEKELLRE